MSRRDTAEAIYDTAADEIEFTEANGKTLVPASKLTAMSATKFLYSRRTRRYMYGELDKLRGMLSDEYGLAIHHIKTWRELND